MTPPPPLKNSGYTPGMVQGQLLSKEKCKLFYSLCHSVYLVFSTHLFSIANMFTVPSGRSRPSDKGGPGHPDLEIRGRGGQKKLLVFFSLV